MDDDFDALTDCSDADCTCTRWCGGGAPPPEDCGNGLDDDSDGFTDTDDPECPRPCV